MHHQHDDTLEDLIFEALQKARSFVAALNIAALSSNSQDGAFISRCVSQIETGRVLDDDVEGVLDAVRKILCREIEEETFETRPVFDGYHDPEFGDVGTVLEIPVRTVRGDDLSESLTRLDALVSARYAALDRLCAEREVRKRI
ncbi:hypothetical protein FIU86_05905 [Roseovarius sp. THAF9]|uniref:hypothetical protein n=1 Tax=Roseovarius sp. THAF9 TaxID=2587847 RepID=UPI0012686079|nr:hypothetical protein [Roseovarius sp. THAF9]QFT92368.1 hypothetical protein FIU86_05905 [Roseovarius sp. THAF9]